jgi:hypothetical protein
MPTTCVYRFLGAVPPPGFPLLVDDDAPADGEEPARLMGQRIRKRVPHIQPNVLEDEPTRSALKEKLDAGHTLRELLAWAEGLTNINDRTKLLKTISVARKLNDKSLLRSVLLPCRQVIFLGFVTVAQPPPPTSAPYGLAHARVVVDGAVNLVVRMFTDDPGDEKQNYHESTALTGDILVRGAVVGKIIGGQHILTQSGMQIRL